MITEGTTHKKVVGILGVSANPMHEGHVSAGKSVLHRIPVLDEVWFMVTPHSPHKDPSVYAPLEHRTHLAHLALQPTARLGDRLKVSDFEAALLRFGQENSTANMLNEFSLIYPNLQPVWMMGADNLATLHTWGRWTEIMTQHPVVVMSRGEADKAALQSVAAKQFADRQVAESDFKAIPGTWTFVDGLGIPYSSTQVRAEIAEGRNPRGLEPSAIMYIQKYGLYGTKKAQ